MKKVVLMVLGALSLSIALVFSPFAQSAPPSFAATSPLSPLPSGSDDAHETRAISSDAVWQLTANLRVLHIRTSQVGVGWWDADGQLHIALQVNGIVEIPLPQAVMVSIPGDAAGVPVPAGWRKLMRPSNGEWVMVQTG